MESAHLLTNRLLLVGEETRDMVRKKLDELGVEIIPFRNPQIVEPARAFAIKKATTSWVFLLDADERMTPLLVREIKEKMPDIAYGYYQVPRKEILFRTHWLKHGGWWPNYQTRLIRKGMFVNWPRHIHSTPVIKGRKGFLTNPLIHYSQNDFSEIVNRTIVFEDSESELLFKAKCRASTITFFRKFFGELFRRLIKWQGFRDGTIGIIESIYQAFSKTITYLYLYEKKSRPLHSLS
jgi:glycosyltransferase involved in cell wall biosynthesis